eukprot:gene13351-biopygen3506
MAENGGWAKQSCAALDLALALARLRELLDLQPRVTGPPGDDGVRLGVPHPPTPEQLCNPFPCLLTLKLGAHPCLSVHIRTTMGYSMKLRDTPHTVLRNTP